MKVKFYFEGSDKFIEVEAKEGDSILDVALDNDIDLNHNCGGVCACSTCHIYVEEGMESLPEISDREEDHIDGADNPKLNSRLACQCDLAKDNVIVTIPDQSSIIGH
jgi:ferredoxin, 2Fe-2S